jgi:hypothetical protein
VARCVRTARVALFLMRGVCASVSTVFRLPGRENASSSCCARDEWSQNSLSAPHVPIRAADRTPIFARTFTAHVSRWERREMSPYITAVRDRDQMSVSSCFEREWRWSPAVDERARLLTEEWSNSCHSLIVPSCAVASRACTARMWMNVSRSPLQARLRRARRACEGAARGAGVPASDRAGVWGGAPR